MAAGTATDWLAESELAPNWLLTGPGWSRTNSACRRLAIRRGLRREPSRPAAAARRGWGRHRRLRAAFDLLIESFKWVGAPDLFPVRHREIGEGRDVVGGFAQHRFHLGQL